jgi:hypothetical protein
MVERAALAGRQVMEVQAKLKALPVMFLYTQTLLLIIFLPLVRLAAMVGLALQPPPVALLALLVLPRMALVIHFLIGRLDAFLVALLELLVSPMAWQLLDRSAQDQWSLAASVALAERQHQTLARAGTP